MRRWWLIRGTRNIERHKNAVGKSALRKNKEGIRYVIQERKSFYGGEI